MINGINPDKERQVTGIAESIIEGAGVFFEGDGRKPVVIGGRDRPPVATTRTIFGSRGDSRSFPRCNMSAGIRTRVTGSGIERFRE